MEGCGSDIVAVGSEDGKVDVFDLVGIGHVKVLGKEKIGMRMVNKEF